MKAYGYAVAVSGSGHICVNTISTTERAAKVNWLVLNGITVYRTHTDEHIEGMWLEHSSRKGYKLIRVLIEETKE